MFNEKFYKRFSLLTIIGVLVLFFMGGLVRTTGAGMGCPDWPKCFEKWVPPLNDESLPEGYESVYIEKRKAKLKRLTAILTTIGMQSQATAIMNDKYVLQPHSYNFARAYTEYANRLCGALTGVFALLALISSFQFWKSNKKITLFTLVGVFWIVFNGWLGSVVVDSNLLEGIVTIHFVAAFLALAFMQIANKLPLTKTGHSVKNLKSLQWLSVTTFVLLFVQIISGTQVREIADSVMRSSAVSMDWLSSESALWSTKFIVHRYLPIVIGIFLVAIFAVIKNQEITRHQRLTFRLMVGVTVIQAIAGVMIIWVGHSAFIQLVHVTLGGLIFALCLNWILEIKRLKVA